MVGQSEARSVEPCPVTPEQSYTMATTPAHCYWQVCLLVACCAWHHAFISLLSKLYIFNFIDFCVSTFPADIWTFKPFAHILQNSHSFVIFSLLENEDSWHPAFTIWRQTASPTDKLLLTLWHCRIFFGLELWCPWCHWSLDLDPGPIYLLYIFNVKSCQQ